MLKLNKIACVLIVALLTFVLLSQLSSVVHGATTTSTTSGSSLRDWLESLKSEASTLQGKSNQLERTVAVLMESNSTIVQTRIGQLSKIKNALNMLNVEIQVINQACSTKGGPDCNIICPKGLNGTECATVSCDSKCLNCSSTGDCLLCSGNWNGTTCSVCKVGWTGSNCTLVDTRGDLITSTILNSTMATRFVSDLILPVKTKDIKLVFRYSRDGLPCTVSNTFALASQVNGKGPTVLIIKATTGAIFGGYTSLNWGNTGYTSDPKAFLFSIQSSTGDHRFAKLSVSIAGNEVDLSSPTFFGFGKGDDLVCGCINGVMTGITLPYTYQSPSQYYLTGSGIPYSNSVGSKFTPSDFELYTL